MGKQILVVDDSPIIRQVEDQTLRGAGYGVVMAVDGMDAMNKLAGGSFNLILTDLNMPNLDGVEFIKKVRLNMSHRMVPIVMVTTESKDSKKQDAKAAGATGWVIKPFTPDQLLHVVKKLIG